MEALLSSVTDALVALLGVLLSVLASYAVAYLKTRLKFVSEAYLQELARSGVAFAEERAAQYLKANGAKLASKLKLESAVKYVLMKAPNITPEEAERIITAELPKVSLGAAGFIQAVSSAMQSPKPPAGQ
jgi:hypothetical protein